MEEQERETPRKMHPAQFAPLYESKDAAEEKAREEQLLLEELRKDEKKKRRELRRDIAETIAYCGIILALTILIKVFVAQPIEVLGPSMQETFHNEDIVLLEKLTTRFGTLKRFDIIVFKPYEDSKELYIKRVIGLPGEVIYVDADGAIHIASAYENGSFIDDHVLEESYGRETMTNTEFFFYGSVSSPVTLSEDEYFVLGDNRNNSTDSRSVRVGTVKKSQIYGKVIWKIIPFGKVE